MEIGHDFFDKIQCTGGLKVSCVVYSLTEAAARAEEVFDGVIKCKVRADQTRNALTVLQRYKFLFNLPRSIEKNITNVCILSFLNTLSTFPYTVIHSMAMRFICPSL